VGGWRCASRGAKEEREQASTGREVDGPAAVSRSSRPREWLPSRGGSSTLWACYLPAGPGRSTVAWPGLQKEQQGAGLKEGGAPPSIPRGRSAVENGDARLKRAIDRGAGTAKGRRLCVLLTRCT
jgi:hypothetical protein